MKKHTIDIDGTKDFGLCTYPCTEFSDKTYCKKKKKVSEHTSFISGFGPDVFLPLQNWLWSCFWWAEGYTNLHRYTVLGERPAYTAISGCHAGPLRHISGPCVQLRLPGFTWLIEVWSKRAVQSTVTRRLCFTRQLPYNNRRYCSTHRTTQAGEAVNNTICNLKW